MRWIGFCSVLVLGWCACAPPGKQPTTLAIQESGLSARLEMMAPEESEQQAPSAEPVEQALGAGGVAH